MRKKGRKKRQQEKETGEEKLKFGHTRNTIFGTDETGIYDISG